MDNVNTRVKSESINSNWGNRNQTSRLKIYVGNLPPGITNEGVRKFMGQFGEIERCDIINRNPRKPYGFITYLTEEAAKAAIDAQGSMMDGRTLIINRSFPSQEAKDGTQEFRRTLYIGSIPLGMRPEVLKQHLLEAIAPIQADFRTHHVPVTRTGNKGDGMVEISTGGKSSEQLQMFAFLVFRSLVDAEKAGLILYDLEVDGKTFLVEFSKGRKMSKYKANTIRTVHIGNIAWSATEEDVRRKFRLFGELTSVRLISDRETGKSKGYAFLDFSNGADAEHAVTVFSGTKWMDRNWKVQLEQKEKRRSENDRRDRSRDNDLDRYHITSRSTSRGYIRERRRSLSPPRRVRQQVVERRAIVGYGVERVTDIPTYTRSPARDEELTLFVSNLPTAARDHRVRYLLEQLTGPMVEFRKRGPDGWCTYEDKLCAMTAHDILRDHRIEGIRLVVEVVGPPVTDRGRGGGRSSAREPISRGRDLGLRERRPPRPDFERRSTKRLRPSEGGAGPGKLFVGNLGHGVNRRDLQSIFEQHGIVTEINLPKKDGKLAGYGFVHFEDADDARYAQRMVNGRQLGNRNLRVEMSTSTKKSDGESDTKRPRIESRYDPIKTEKIKQERPSSSFQNPYAARVTSPQIQGGISYDNLSREPQMENLGDMIGVSLSEGVPFELV